MTDQIEEGQKKGKLSRSWSSFRSYGSRGTFLYSAGVGAACGLSLCAAALVMRAAKIYFWDEEYLRLQSRRRYLEKQNAFFSDLQEKMKAHYIANVLVREYDPVDTRLPFQSIQDRFRF